LLWKQNAGNTALADPKTITTKNKHDKKFAVNSKSKRIAVEVFI
jgi:hypothetical protein